MFQIISRQCLNPVDLSNSIRFERAVTEIGSMRKNADGGSSAEKKVNRYRLAFRKPQSWRRYNLSRTGQIQLRERTAVARAFNTSLTEA
ncbi:MAG: hypothetical protein ACRD3W_28115 [Terriglobales bacterium]